MAIETRDTQNKKWTPEPEPLWRFRGHFQTQLLGHFQTQIKGHLETQQ